MFNPPVPLMLLLPREEFFFKICPIHTYSLSTWGLKTFPSFFILQHGMGELKGVLIVVLGEFSLSVVPPKKGDMGVGFAAPAERSVRFDHIFPGNSKDPWFPPVPVGWVRNQGHPLRNAWWPQQHQSPWFSRYLLLGYAFQLSPKCSLSLGEWSLQR